MVQCIHKAMFFECVYLFSLLAGSSCVIALLHVIGHSIPIVMQVVLGWFMLWVGVDWFFLYPNPYRKSPLEIVQEGLHAIEKRLMQVECALMGITRLERRISQLECNFVLQCKCDVDCKKKRIYKKSMSCNNMCDEHI